MGALIYRLKVYLGYSVLKSELLLLLLGLVVVYFSQNLEIATTMVISGMMAVFPKVFSEEEKSNSLDYFKATPLTRGEIVGSYFAMYLICCALALINLGLFIGAAEFGFHLDFDADFVLGFAAGIMMAYAWILSLAFKLPLQKFVILIGPIIVAVVVALVGLGWLFVQLFGMPDVSVFSAIGIVPTLIIAFVINTVISYGLSLAFIGERR
ncbi:ABC-2 transporter permease [Peptoniphilus equinus]|uniref:ABC-2 transporter permease n=1 Tax=Peptoniphilus equinus TaxID=3016343 RepID=A0ABY7QVE4_9FIRM|nr:ABC-2 transporter permease [Peptoniphilus equinus]WBW50311.1 ABC-2 transporter permease [Peptoniphilus equinus]